MSGSTMSRFYFTLPLLVLPALSLATGTSCSSSMTASVGTSDAGTIFVPHASDFTNYEKWNRYYEEAGMADSVPAPGQEGGTALVHNAGVRIEYINRKPPHGSTTFPVGTIIVKEIPAQQQVFAMVKTGGGYNKYDAGGEAGVVASNWEFIELSGPQNAISFLWQGLPPSSQPYSGNNPQVCNECHSVLGRGNDFVPSPAIRLEDF